MLFVTAGHFAEPAHFGLQLAKRSEVLLENRVRLDAVLEALEICLELLGRLSGEGLDHPILMARGLDHSLVLQISKVLGDADLGLVEQLLEVADAEGAAGEEIDDAQPRLVAETFVDSDEIGSGSSFCAGGFAHSRRVPQHEYTRKRI